MYVDVIDRITDYENIEQVHFPVKKVFILVTDTMYTPQRLDSENLESCKNLETILLDRSGIRRREYHSSVYKIGNTPWYVVCEGASPLQTFHEAAMSNERLQLFSREISISFIKLLKKLLWDDLRTRDTCEVVLVTGKKILACLIT